MSKVKIGLIFIVANLVLFGIFRSVAVLLITSFVLVLFGVFRLVVGLVTKNLPPKVE